MALPLIFTGNRLFFGMTGGWPYPASFLKTRAIKAFYLVAPRYRRRLVITDGPAFSGSASRWHPPTDRCRRRRSGSSSDRSNH